LIVEDEAIVAADIAEQLDRLGYAVGGQTARGEDAVVFARDLRPDLVLMDIQLAGQMDGIIAAEAIHRECGVPVIYLTAHSDTATLERAKLTDPFGYILKPFEERDLRTHIEIALYRHQTERALRESEERFRTLAAATFEGIVITDNAVIVDANEQFAKMHGYELDEVIGKPATQFQFTEDHERATDVLRSGSEQINEFRDVCKDGSIIVVETHGRPFVWAGRRARITAMRDITEWKRADSALRASEERFRMLVEQAVDGIFVSDAAGYYTDANTAGCQMLGYSREEILSRSIADVLAEDEIPRIGPEVARFADGPVVTSEWRFRRNDGSFFAGEVVGRKLPDGRLLGILRDITERKRSEAALRYQAEMLDNVSDAVLSTDADFRIQTWNKAAEKIYGWQAEEALGKDADSLLRTEFLVPGSREEAADQLMATGFAQTEVHHRDRHGRELTVHGNVTLLKNAQGEVTGTLGVLRDVTERKCAEEKVFELSQRLQALMNALPVGVSFSSDATCRTITGNPAVLRQFSVTAEDNLSASAADSSAPGRLVRYFRNGVPVPDWDLPLQQAVARNRVTPPTELEVELPNGRCWIAEASAAPIHDENGKVVAGVAITLDITARNRAEQALKEAQAQLADHAENLEKIVAERTAELRVRTAEREHLQQELLTISEREKLLISQELHDGLCQNLAGTAMMVSILARSLAARADKDAEAAKQICALLNSSVHEARNLSHGLHPVGPEGEGLMNALSELAGTVTNLFHIRCTFHCPKPVILENGTTSTHLFRIAQEAINNARKHGEADEVRISLANTAKGVVLSIRDNGVGIPSDLSKKRGMGLKSMGYCAAEIGATLSVRRGSRKGTVVSCILPTCESAR